MRNRFKWTAAVLGLAICAIFAFAGFGALVDGEALSKIEPAHRSETALFCLLLGLGAGSGVLSIGGWMIDKRTV